VTAGSAAARKRISPGKSPELALALAAGLAMAGGLAAPGCGDAWPERPDGRPAVELAGRELREILRDVNSQDPAKRLIALRLVSHQAGQAWRAGRTAEAIELGETVFRRYAAERNAGIRLCLVRVCAPALGTLGGKTIDFLRNRIAAGEMPGHSALALAFLDPQGAFGDIEPLTRHPEPEIRLQAAEALTTLPDPRGFAAVARVWANMTSPAWPETIRGVPLPDARSALAARAARNFGRPLLLQPGGKA
jgi:hypothetical protein